MTLSDASSNATATLVNAWFAPAVTMTSTCAMRLLYQSAHSPSQLPCIMRMVALMTLWAALQAGRPWTAPSSGDQAM